MAPRDHLSVNNNCYQLTDRPRARLRALEAMEDSRHLRLARRVSLHTMKRGRLRVPLRESSPIVGYIKPCDRRFLSRMSVGSAYKILGRNPEGPAHRHGRGGDVNEFFDVLM